MPSAQMVFDIIARDGASGSFRAVSREASGAAASFDRLGKAAAGITVVFAAFAVNAAVKFESAMTRISTQAGVPIGQIKALGDAILKLSPKVGFNPDELATSLYHVESAFRTTGITAGKAIDIVAQASKLAKIGNANLEDTTQAIIGVLSSKIKGVKDAADAAAQLNQLVGTGDTTLSAVTKAVASGILPTASSLGLSFKDVAAALATLTDNATPADEAATRLRTTLSLIENPAPKAQAALRSIGVSSSQLAEDFRKPDGLLLALEDLKTHLDKTYSLSSSKPLSLDQITKAGQSFRDEVVAQGASTVEADKLTKKYVDGLKQGGSAATQQARVILQAFGGARTGATFLTLFDELDRLKSKYKDFGTSAQAAAKFQEAWANQQKTAKQKLDELKASWDVFLVQVGNAILPDLKKVVDVLAKHPGIIKAAAGAVALLAAAWTASKFASVFSIIGRLTTAILGIGAASTTAAAETAAANLGGGAAAAEGAGAAGLAGRGAAAGEGAAAARGGAGLLGGLGLGTAVGAGAATAGAVLIPSFLLTHQLEKSQSVRDLPKIDAFIGKPNFIEDRLPKLKLDENKAALQDYAKSIGDLDLKLKNFYGDAKDNKAIHSFQDALKNANNDLQSSSRSLDLHAAKTAADRSAIVANRSALEILAGKADLAAKAYEHGTGVQSDYTAALRLSIPQILDQAQSTGISRQAAADYLNQILKIPGYHVTTLGLVKDAAQKAINDYLIAISQIPRFVTTYINAVATGTTQSVAGGTQGTIGGLFGAGAAGQIPGHAAGGIAKGWSWVGERGPELIHVGSPSRVLNHEDSMAATGGSGSLVTIHEFHAHDEVDVNSVAQKIAFKNRAVMTSLRV